MNKIAVGPKAKGRVNLDAPIEDNLYNLSKALNKPIRDITVTMLDRPRHEELIYKVRKVGARIKLFQDGDVAAAMATCFEDSGVDMLVGIGGGTRRSIGSSSFKMYGRRISRKIISHEL